MLVGFNWQVPTISVLLSTFGICDFGLHLLERIGALHLYQKSLVHRLLYCEFSQKVVSYRIVIPAEKLSFFAWKPHFLPILSPYVSPFLRIEPANVIPVTKATNPVDFPHNHPHPNSLVGRLAVSW